MVLVAGAIVVEDGAAGVELTVAITLTGMFLFTGG